ncbi:uncharacterized protein OCT59_018772 [Rhizophagus irregularis]|uniref:uncharacterized protein n=1 Tax=Rhizophagus irregularis TaxID=588596 RepID=UPI00333127B8|nr:hypothetical protein OCT59_018772 [Rhizophagus irregularis]
MRRRYSHNKPIEPIRIRNRFSYSKPNETTDSDERVAIRSPVRSPDNDNDDMDFQYDHKDDLSFQDINDDDNAYGSINPQDYNDEMIFSQDNVNSSDTEEEEESDNEYNYEEEEEEEDNNENNDEEEEDEGNNDDNNNQVEEERNNDEEERNYDEEERNNDEEERNNDEEERNNEEEEIHQIVEALDEDKIPFCNVLYRSGDFVYYRDDNGQKKLGRLRSILKNHDGYYQLRIQKILEYSDLPGNLKGLPRQRRSITGEVWLQDEPFLIIMTSQILEKVTILMMFQHQNIPDEMKELEKGKVMTVQGQDAWIIAGLGVVTADLPQGNDMTEILRHNANKGCRTCKTTKESLSAHNQGYRNNITDQLCTEYGLRSLPSILDKLKRERHLQTPQDVYHATAGKIGRLLKLTCELFSREGEDNFIEIWKNFEIPKRWSRLPNPITHYNSFMMSDLLRLAMIMPFLLNQFLKESSIETYEELQQCLEEEFSILPKVFVNFVNLPNIHVNMHLLMHAKTFGTLLLIPKLV